VCVGVCVGVCVALCVAVCVAVRVAVCVAVCSCVRSSALHCVVVCCRVCCILCCSVCCSVLFGLPYHHLRNVVQWLYNVVQWLLWCSGCITWWPKWLLLCSITSQIYNKCYTTTDIPTARYVILTTLCYTYYTIYYTTLYIV